MTAVAHRPVDDTVQQVVDLARLVDVDTRSEALEAARTDRSGWRAPGLPLAVARPSSVAEVVASIRWAAQNRVTVVPRGAGSGLAGGAAAGAGSLVLDLTGLNRIHRIDPDDALAVVDPGVVTADLDRAARRHGLGYSPDPGSVEISTVGGNIATNAGGLRCAKYGATRDAVLALDVVLADGSLIRTGSTAPRSVVGYDLTSLFVGSEGTLGIVVGATVRLTPLAAHQTTIAGRFPDVEAAAQAAASIVRAGIRPAMLELLAPATLRAIAALDPDLFATPPPPDDVLLLVRTDGYGAAAEAAAVVDLLAPVARGVEHTDDPDRAEQLVRARRLALPAVERLGAVLIEDICVPRSKLAVAIREIERISAEGGVPVFTFAHAADGIIHPLVLAGPSSTSAAVQAVPYAAQATADAIFALALDLGGAVTGEHGIGVLKRRWLAAALDPGAGAVTAAIKHALDPTNLLNPGKAIGSQDHPPI